MADARALLSRTVAVVERGMAEKLHVGAQLFLSVEGRSVADLAFGISRPGVAMTPDSLMMWHSSSKAVTAVAVAQQWELGAFDLDDPVADYIPEFGQNGKGEVTIRHLLTHTAGFRFAGGEALASSWDEALQKIYAAPLEPGWVPGEKAGYHPTSAWYVLGELVQRLDGRLYPQYLRDEIFEPLGMSDCWIGMPPERYRAYGDRIGIMHNTEGAEPRPLPFADSEAVTARCIPGGNGRGPMRELARLYEMLLGRGEREGVRILRSPTVEAITARQRAGMHDETFGTVMDWGFGFIVNTNVYGKVAPYDYGAHASPRAFGHSGRQSSAAFADPEYAIAAAVVFNGQPGEVRHSRRQHELFTALYEDLGVSWSDPVPAQPPRIAGG
jgi:CubicO group peptidase (beta-lactamase class C family)